MESYRLRPEDIEELKHQWTERINHLKQELKKKQRDNRDELEDELKNYKIKLPRQRKHLQPDSILHL